MTEQLTKDPLYDFVARNRDKFDTVLDLMLSVLDVPMVPGTSAARGKRLSSARKAIKQGFAAAFLDNADIKDWPSYSVYSPSKVEAGGNIKPYFADAVNSISGLRFDHMSLATKDRRPVALITQPYDQGAGFVPEGENDLATWKSYNAASWWLPGETRLIVAIPKRL